MSSKPKLPQPETPSEVQVRDLFETPRYAVELILPFIPKDCNYIWECCAGTNERMAKVIYQWLESTRCPHKGVDHTNHVCSAMDMIVTDISSRREWDCLKYDPADDDHRWDCMITNPPFSIKRKVWDRFVAIGKPFALLLPADYSGWVNRAVNRQGGQKIIPEERRIDYITPNILERIHKGEVLKLFINLHPDAIGRNGDDPKWDDVPTGFKEERAGYHFYTGIESVDQRLLAAYSTSQFHSMFLCYKFNLGKTETFVPLSREDKLRIL